MKHSLSTLFQRRLAQAAALLAILAAVGVAVAWSDPPEARVQLGGAWIAQLDNGARVSATYGAVDSSGLCGVYRGQVVFPPSMLATMGVDSVTDLVSDEVVTGRDTSESTGIMYGISGGNIVLILADHSYFTHVSPSEKHNTHDTLVYIAAFADLDNDGLPDPDAQPFTVLPSTSISKRITR